MIRSITETPVLPSTRRKNELSSIVPPAKGQSKGDGARQDERDERRQRVFTHVQEDRRDGAGSGEHRDGKGEYRNVVPFLARLIA